MTPEQYANWKDFAFRMAREGWPKATQKRRERIHTEIESFFGWFDIDGSFASVTDWDAAPAYICDQVSDHLSEHYHDKLHGRTGEYRPRRNWFHDQVNCCIRAGLDVASAPSAGVLGFTVGTLRRMYPERIPDWVTNFFEPPLPPDAPDDNSVWL